MPLQRCYASLYVWPKNPQMVLGAPPEYLLVTPGLLSPSTNQGTGHASPGGHGAHTESPVCSRVRPCTRRLNNPEQLLCFLRSERDRPPAAFTVVRSGHV